ncbi:MAG: Uma2 family endonuclease [Pirellulaceae bacterium]
MATATPVGEKLLTIDDMTKMPSDGRLHELVRGRLVEMNFPRPKHGFICSEISGLLRDLVKPRKLGRVFSNDSGVIIERDPDTLRGPDVGYYSYTRVPRGKVPEGYFATPPEIAFEVLSPSDTWPETLKKVAELLDAGVNVVCVADPRNNSVQVHTADQPVKHLAEGDDLTFPAVLPGFSCKVAQCFDID